MASPNYNTLHVALSKMIGDPVAAAATNGNSFTSVNRDLFLNDAIRNFIRLKIRLKDKEAIRGYVRTKTDGTLSSSKVLAISGFSPTVDTVLDVYNTTQAKEVRPIPIGYTRYQIENTTNSLETALYYVVENNDLTVINGVTSDVVKVEYVANHTDMTADASSDMLISLAYKDELLMEAYNVFASQYPEEESLARLQLNEARLNRALTLQKALGNG